MRKIIKSCKGDRSSTTYMQTCWNNTWLLNGNYKSWKGLDKYSINSKRPLMPAQATIPSTTITIYGERKICHDKTKCKHYLSPNPALQKALEKTSSSLKRLDTPKKKKTQGISNPRIVNQKSGRKPII